MSFIQGRSTLPGSRHRWPAGWEDVDSLAIAKNGFQAWDGQVIACQHLFEKNVYGNAEAGEADFRYHRMLLYSLIAQGEWMAMQMIDAGTPEASSYLALIEQKLLPLKQTLFEWHGPTDNAGVPEDFARAMREVASEKVVDLEKALTEPPAA